MGLLKSVDTVPGINFYEYRDDAYYGKYQYRVRFEFPYAKYTWICKTPEDLDIRINAKKGYLKIRADEVAGVIASADDIKAFIKFRNETKKNKEGTVRVEYNSVSMFSNDLSFLKSVEAILPGLQFDYTEVQTSQYAGVKQFVGDPKHKFRVYLKSKRVDESFSKDLKDLFIRNKTLYPSEALRIWVRDATNDNHKGTWRAWKNGYCSSTYFIDYDDEATLSYIALMHDGMLGKRYKLEKRPVTV
jgi:hypothetical protein